MSVEQAQGLVRRFIEDEEFRRRLETAPVDQRREIIVEAGYGDVRLRHMSAALPEANGGELSDEEFAAIAGGGDATMIGTIAASAVGTAVGGTAAVFIGIILA